MSTNWPWNILALDGQPEDTKSVKRAYAKRLKAIDPATDPEAFQNLRQAYETALNWVTTVHRTD